MAQKARRRTGGEDVLQSGQPVQPVVPVRPVPIRQQDLGSLGARTDRMGVAPVLQQGLVVEEKIRVETPEARNTISLADGLIAWSERAKNADFNGRNYSPEAQYIGDMARQAKETLDPNLLQRAQGLSYSFILMAGTQAKLDAQENPNSPDSIRLSQIIQRSRKFFTDPEQHHRTMGTSIAGYMYMENRQVYDNNQEMKQDLFNTMETFSDHSRTLRPEQISAAFATITSSLDHAIIQLENARGNIGALSMNHVQALISIESVREKMKSKMEALDKALKKLTETLSDEKKSSEEKEQELAKVEKEINAFVADAIKIALKDADAPDELIGAIEKAKKFLKKADLRERGQRIILAGMMFLNNRIILDLPENEKLRESFLDAISELADEKKKISIKLRTKLLSIQNRLGEAIMKAAGKPEVMIATITQALDNMKIKASKIGNKYLAQTVDYLKGIVKRIKSPVQLRKIAGLIGYLGSALDSLSKMPGKTKSEKSARNNIASLVANAILISLKEPRSEEAKMARLLAGAYAGFRNGELLLSISRGLKDGSLAIDKAKEKITRLILQEADISIAKIKGVNPDLAKKIGNFFKMLRKNPESTSASIIGRAIDILGLANFASKKVLPHKNKKIRKGVLGVIGDAIDALQKGNHEEFDSSVGVAAALLGMPEHEAEAILDEREQKIEEAEKREELGKYNTFVALEGLLGKFGQMKIADGKLSESISYVRKEIQKIQSKLQNGESVNPGEMKKLEKMIAYVEAAIGILKGRSGWDVKGQEKILGEGAKAFIVSEQLRAMVEILKGPKSPAIEDAARAVLGEGADEKKVKALSEEYKKDNLGGRIRELGGLASLHIYIAKLYDMSHGASDKKKFLDMSSAIAGRRMKAKEALQDLANDYTKEIGRIKVGDPVIKTVLETIKKGLGTPSIRKLEMAQDAIEFAKVIVYEQDMLKMKQYDSIRKTSMDMLRSALFLLQQGAGSENVNSLISLAKMLRENHKDPEMRKLVEGACTNANIGTMLYQMVLATRGKQGTSIEDAAKKVISLLNPGSEISKNEIESLVNLYQNAEKAYEKPGGSAVVALESFKETSMFIEIAKRKKAVEIMQSRATGQVEKSIYKPLIGALERALSAAASGEKPKGEDIVLIQRSMIILSGDPGDVRALFITSKDPEIQKGQAEIFTGLENIGQLLKPLRGVLRERTAVICAKAQEELAKGNLSESAVYLSLAKAYARARTPNERKEIQNYITRFSKSFMSDEEILALAEDERPIKSADALWLSQLYRERSEMYSAIGSPSLQRNFLAYSELALKAYQQGDHKGSNLMRNLAVFYARAAVGNVSEVLALADGNKEIPSLKKFRQGIERGQSVAQIIGAKKGEEEKALSEFGLMLCEIDIVIGSATFESRMKNIDSDKAQYKAEAGRLGRLQTTAMQKKNIYEAERLGYHIKLSDIEKTKAWIEKSKLVREEATRLLRLSLSKEKESLDANEKDAAKLLEEAAMLRENGERLLWLAENIQTSALLFHTSITQVGTIHRDRGRHECAAAADKFTAITEELMAAGAMPDATVLARYEIALKSANQNLQMGASQISQQRGIQSSVWGLVQRAEKLTKDNQKFGKEYGKEVKPLTGYPDTRSSKLAYDQKAIQKKIDGGRSLAISERIGAAGAALGNAGFQMNSSVLAAVICKKHWNLIKYASETEKKYGMLEFSTGGWLAIIEKGQKFADQGRMAAAEEQMSFVKYEFVQVQSWKQNLHNTFNSNITLWSNGRADARMHARKLADRHYDITTEREASGIDEAPAGPQPMKTLYRTMRAKNRQRYVKAVEKAWRDWEKSFTDRGRFPSPEAEEKFRASIDQLPEIKKIVERNEKVEKKFWEGNLWQSDLSDSTIQFDHALMTSAPNTTKKDWHRYYSEVEASNKAHSTWKGNAQDANEQANKAKGRAVELHWIKQRTQTTQDVPDANPALNQMLAMAVVANDVMVQEIIKAGQRGEDHLPKGLGEITPEMKKRAFNYDVDPALAKLAFDALILRQRARNNPGKGETLLKQAEAKELQVAVALGNDPKKMDIIATHLMQKGVRTRIGIIGASSDKISEVLARNLFYMAKHRDGTLKFQQHESGRRIATDAVNMFIQTHNARYNLKRARPHGFDARVARRQLELAAGSFLGMARTASSDTAYAHYQASQGELIEQMEKAYIMYGEAFAGLATPGGVKPEAVTEEMGTAFQLMREYPSVAEVAKLNVRLMHATWGIHIDPETGETSKLHMSPKEQMALISALDSANGALEQMLGIASSLRTFMSTGAGDEGHDALLELEKHIAKVEEQIGIIIDHAAARDPEDVMEYGITDEMKEKDLNEITGKIKSHRNAAWKKVEGLIETGVAWDTAVMIGETLVKTVAYSALACSGYGTAAGAAGLAETYVGMEELVASRGGLDQMKTRELWTYYGSYALAGAGFAIGGLSDSMRIARGLSSPAIGTIGAEIPGTSRLLPRALDRTMSVLSSGTVEKATNVGGLLLMGGGIGIGGLEVYNMYKDGATSAAQYGLAFWNALNPALAIGGSKVMSLNPKLAHSRSLGATAYRGMMGALFGISQGEMVAAHKTQVQQQYYAMRKSRVAGIRGRNRQETRKAQAQQWTMDEGAFTAIEKRHGPLTTEERMAVLEHYSSGEGGPRQINPDEAVTLLGKYNALVESRMGELHPDARTRIEQIPDLIGRQLENGEILAIIQEFGHEIPGTARTEIVGGKPVTKVKVDVGRIMQFLDGKRITAAQTGTKPFYTLTDYAAFYDKASAGLEPPAAVAKPKDTGGTLFRLDAAARARDYKKTRDIMLGMTIAGYSDEHVAFAREVAIAADYFANYNEVPPGTPTEVAQAAEKLAGKKGTKSNFRDASNHGNAQTQLKLALGATNQIFAKQATQSDSVIELGLHTPEGVAKFARKIVRMDSDALETLEGLPYEIQKAVKGLAADPRFGMAARASDSEQTIAKLAGPGGKLNEAAQKAAKKIEPELPLSQEASEIPVLKAAGDGLTPVIGEEIATQPKTKSDQTKAMKISIAGGGKVQIPVPETPATISGETVGAQPEVPLRLVKPVGKIAATTKVTDEGIQIISYGGVAKDGEIPELLVIKTGKRALVINSNYILGKHGTGSGSAGSKLGTISNADELLAFVRQHVNLEELKEKGVTVIPNVSAGKGQKTSTDTLVKIVNVRMDGEEVPVGTELKKGVDYVAVVQDADGTEFEAPLRMVLTREEPETWMPQIFTDRKAPDTDQINIIVGRVDLDDSRAAWVNPPALVEKIGEDTEVFAIYTAFPGGYAPAANPPLSLNHDPIVGMRGTEFWNVHALMNKPPRETDMVSGAQLAAFVGELLSGKADVRKAAQGQLEKMPLAIQAEVNGFIHKIRETEASGKRVSLQLAISMAEPYAQKIKDVIITEESALAIVLSDREAAAASKAAPSEEITVPVPVVEETPAMPRRKRITELAALAHDSVYGDAAQKAKAAGQIESLDAGEQKVYAKFENLAKRTKERGEDFSPEHYSRAYWEQNAEPEELAAQTKADAKIVSKLVDTYNKINQMESKSIGHGFHTSREYRRMLKYIADGNTPQQAAEMVVTEYRNHEIQFSMERKARSERPSIPTETVPLATYEGAIGERVGRADLEKVLVGVDERTRRIARVRNEICSGPPSSC